MVTRINISFAIQHVLSTRIIILIARNRISELVTRITSEIWSGP